jgi:hypothetical protein
MSAAPAKRANGAGKGPARGYSWPPFENGNRAAIKSAFYATKLAASEREEVAEITDVLRDLSPLDGDAQEPLLALTASMLWRQRVAVKYIDDHGIDQVAKSSSLLRDLATLERSLLANLKALALTPQAAADLGLTWARTSALRFDPDRLTNDEQATLDRLIAKAEIAEESS